MKLYFSKIFQISGFLVLLSLTAVIATSLTKTGWGIYSIFLLSLFFCRQIKQSCLSVPFFFLPFACAFDLNSVLLIFLSTILFSELSFENRDSRFTLPFFTILILAGWFVQHFLDIQDIVYVVKQYSINTWLETVGMGLEWYRALVQITLWSIGFILFRSLSRDEELRCAALKNVFYGSVVAVFSFVFQPLFMPKLYAGMNDYWLKIGRMSGSFSDPNSAGISLFIISFLIIYALKQQYFRGKVLFLKFLLLFVVLAALYSGSRSFILGVITSLLVLLFISKRVLFYWILGMVLLIFSLINIATFYFGTEWISVLPITLHRTMNTLYLPNTLEMLSSRFLFWNIGWQIFRDNWIVGIGLDRFYDYFPYYTLMSGVEPSGWSDSACSIIFGVLTDGGLLLVLALLFSFRSLGLQKTNGHIEAKNNVLFACLFGLCVIHLSFHLLFFEVVLLLALLASFVFKFEENKNRCFIYTFLFILICIYSFYQYKVFSNFNGLYNYEVSNNQLKALTKRSLKFNLPCVSEDNNKKAILKFTVLRPHREQDKIFVSYETPLEENKIEIKNRNVITEKLDCGEREVLPIQIKVSKAWLKGKGKKLDPRLMSMRVYFEKCGDKWCHPVLKKMF